MKADGQIARRIELFVEQDINGGMTYAESTKRARACKQSRLGKVGQLTCHN